MRSRRERRQAAHERLAGHFLLGGPGNERVCVVHHRSFFRLLLPLICLLTSVNVKSTPRGGALWVRVFGEQFESIAAAFEAAAVSGDNLLYEICHNPLNSQLVQRGSGGAAHEEDASSFSLQSSRIVVSHLSVV